MALIAFPRTVLWWWVRRSAAEDTSRFCWYWPVCRPSPARGLSHCTTSPRRYKTWEQYWILTTNEADYDSFIHQSVEAERALIGRLKPDLAIVDSRPTLRLTAALEGIDVVWITSAYNMPEYSYPIHLPEFVRTWDDIIERTKHREWTYGATFGEMYLLCDIPEWFIH